MQTNQEHPQNQSSGEPFKALPPFPTAELDGAVCWFRSPAAASGRIKVRMTVHHEQDSGKKTGRVRIDGTYLAGLPPAAGEVYRTEFTFSRDMFTLKRRGDEFQVFEVDFVLPLATR